MSQKKNGRNFTVEAQSLPKTPTGIKGLDEVLNGGLPAGCLTVINGGPGSGKTVLGLELLVHGTQLDQPAVFISFEESSEAMRRNALAMGWDLGKIEEAGNLVLINPEIDYDAVSSGEFNINGLYAILEGQARRIGASLLVIDAIDMLMRLFDDPTRARNQLLTLQRWISSQNLTVVMTVKTTDNIQQEYAYVDFMADCVIRMDQRIQGQVSTRRLNVVKYRGSDFVSREQPFVITKQGIVVMSLSSIDLVKRTTGEFVLSGNDKLDAILGGGFRRGSSIIINGASGSGKTTLAFMLTTESARRGDRVLFISFEQSELAITSEMKSVGFDLEALIEQDTLRVTSVVPESMGMEEHLYFITKQIEEYKPEHMVVDAVSACLRIGSPQAAMEFLIRLYHVAKKRGITCIFTNQTSSFLTNEIEISGLGISSLVDSAIILNYFREKDSIGRTMLVLKSRGTNHSDKYHEFRITGNGIVLANSANE